MADLQRRRVPGGAPARDTRRRDRRKARERGLKALARAPAPHPLSELAQAVGTQAPVEAQVTGIALDSREVAPGDLFVALPGTRADGRAFAAEAAARGAVAVVASEPVPDAPTLVVPDPRAAAAELAAALNDHPAEKLRLIGVSGTLGKTSTTFLLRNALAAGGEEIGVIGSLGIHMPDEVIDTGMTTPDAPVLQGALRRMAETGLRLAAMEVTSHALVQHRIDGLAYDLGILTNLVPDEHLEFHPTPEDYLRAKVRFFELLAPGAPLVLNVDDALVRRHTAALPRPLVGVTGSGRADAAVAIEDLALDRDGSAFTLRIREPLPRLSGGGVPPQAIPIRFPVLGLPQVTNLALAATGALIAGASAQAIAEGAARSRPIRRRMEVVRGENPMVLDDTVGNPRSLRGVFDTVGLLPAQGRVRVLFGIRGLRGTVINEGLARTLAEALPAGALLVVTASEDTAGPRDRVQDAEREVVLAILRQAGTDFAFEPRLQDAVERVLDGVGADDLVLLLGAQGLDAGARLVRGALSRGAQEPNRR
ncbi:MAG TPA: Mur ligase family protein [Beijerinckiaceae bacterium]|nr:Mur ligase family protein [Beijerinckiaceae bacterium]